MQNDHRQRVPETSLPRSPRIEYRSVSQNGSIDNALAIVRFGSGPQASADSLAINVGLDAVGEILPDAIWYGAGPVTSARRGRIRYTHDGEFLFGAIEEHEADHADIRAAAAAVYATINEFRRTSSFPHLLRMWNFLDAINEGDGDAERYRQFCIGRAEGFGESARNGYPAATAIGRQQRNGLLQVFWIAGKTPGTAVENPRQVSAYRYPRAHGPVSPSFSRATIMPDGTLLISGTASIVGHASQHPNDAQAQLGETLRNLDALIVHAHQHRASVDANAELLLTVYIRNPEHADAVIARIRNDLPQAQAIFMAADICRRELLLEIECVVQRKEVVSG